MRRIFSTSRNPIRPRLAVALLVLLLAGALWWFAVQRGWTPGLQTQESVPQALSDSEPEPSILGLPWPGKGESPATTEADPPPDRDGISWGHRAGLHLEPDPLHLKASAAYVVDPRSGETLLRKNEGAVLPIASLTKLMTALVLTSARLPMNETVTITEDDVDRERHSRSRLRVGTALKRSEALRLALMSSENRAAHALGRTYPGGLAAFVVAMNARARALGMKDSTFVEPTGLSNRNQSTARDLAVLAAAAAADPLIRDDSTTPTHEVVLGRRAVRFNNSDRLVKSSRWDIHLQKTGYIVEAGQCLVVNATMAGRNLILVLLDSADKASRIADAERIRRWVTGAADPPAGKPRGLRSHIREHIGKPVSKLKQIGKRGRASATVRDRR